MLLSRLLTLRSIRSRLPRFLLSAFGIILGVAGFLAIRVTNQAAMDSISRLFLNTSGRAKLTISSASVGETGFSRAIASTVSRVPGISVVDPIVRCQTDLAERASSNQLDISMFGTGGSGLLLYGIDPVPETQVRGYKLVEGRFVSSNLKKREVVLVESYARDKEIRLGELIKIITPNGPQELRVVGLIARDGPGLNNNGAFGVVPLVAAQQLFNRADEVDQIDLVTTTPDPSTKELSTLQATLQARLGPKYVVGYPAGQGDRMTQMLQNYQIGLNFMSGIALFVGAFLIYNAFAMTVTERTREIGMLRTIGVTRGQVMGQVLLEATLLGVMGAGLGLGLGILLARGLTRLMEVILNQQISSVQMSTPDAAFSLLLGLGVTLLAAGLPALQASRISPIEALRVRGKPTEGWLIRFGWTLGILLLGTSIALLILNPFPYDVQFRLGSLAVFSLFTGVTLLIPATVGVWELAARPLLRLVYGSSGSLGSRNVQRSRLRTTLTVAALMVGVAMVIMVRGMTDSFAGDLRTWINAYLGGDIYVSSSVRLRDDVQRRIQSVDGVAVVTPIRYFSVRWKTPPSGKTETISFMALDVRTYSQITDFIFSGKQVNPQQAIEELLNGPSVFISSVLADKYHLAAGDRITLRTRLGYQDFRVAGVVVDFYNQGLEIQGDWQTMDRYFNVRDADLYLVKVSKGESVDQVRDRIDRLYGSRYNLTLIANAVIRSRITQLMGQAFSMFDVLALISIVVGSLGIINTLTMSVIERTQEIGMLRAIGTTRWQTVRMVLAEAGLMGAIGGVLGLATGVVLARILFVGMTAMSGYELTFVLPPEGVIISLVMALLVSQLAAIPPAIRAARTRILEALQYE